MEFNNVINGYYGIADTQKRFVRLLAIKEKIAMLENREAKYKRRGIHYEMRLAFELMKLTKRIKDSDFHDEYFHDGYCDCLFCRYSSPNDYPLYVYLKSYKLKMVYFEVLKMFRSNNSFWYFERKTTKYKKGIIGGIQS